MGSRTGTVGRKGRLMKLVTQSLAAMGGGRWTGRGNKKEKCKRFGHLLADYCLHIMVVLLDVGSQQL